MKIKIAICLYIFFFVLFEVKAQNQTDTVIKGKLVLDSPAPSKNAVQEFIDGSHIKYQNFRDSINNEIIDYNFFITSGKGLFLKKRTVINIKIDTINKTSTFLFIEEINDKNYAFVKYSLTTKLKKVTNCDFSYHGYQNTYKESTTERKKATINKLELIEDSIKVIDDEFIVKYGNKENKNSLLYSYSVIFLEEPFENKRIVQMEFDKITGYIKSLTLVEEGYNMFNIYFSGLKIHDFKATLWEVLPQKVEEKK